VQFSTIDVFVAMPMTRWEFRIVPCLAGGNICLCNMLQDAGYAFCRCTMTCAFEFASEFCGAILLLFKRKAIEPSMSVSGSIGKAFVS